MMDDLRNIDEKLKKPIIINITTEGVGIGMGIILILLIVAIIITPQIPYIQWGLENPEIVEDYSFKYSKVNNHLTISIADYQNCLRVSISSGLSMFPYSKSEGGWNVVDNCIDPQTLEVGDVIVFDSTGMTIFEENTGRTMHRIISIDYKNKTLVTKGDNNNTSDGNISFDKIIGKLIGRFNATHSEN